MPRIFRRRISGAQGQHAIGLDHRRKPLEDAGFGLLVEIDQNVSAENHVERTKMRKILQQVELPMLHHGANSD